jgi:hypothetical protein
VTGESARADATASARAAVVPARATLSRQPLGPRSAAATLARQPALGVARAAERAGTEGAGAGSGGAGGDSDAIYDEVLRRLRQEQEQLGQLINHPF